MEDFCLHNFANYAVWSKVIKFLKFNQIKFNHKSKKHLCWTWCISFLVTCGFVDFPGGSDGKASVYKAGDPGLSPGFGKIPWRRKWQSIPVLLPGKSHGQRSLVGYSLWGRKELDMTERLSAVATGLEKVSFHSSSKERQCQRMLKLPHNCTHLTC